MNDWPKVEGRYKVGNKTSPIAVCTNASIDDIEIDLKKIAIIGKCVTENIGIEKIIQNIVSNPNIRYLILCGKKSKGHFISQAIESLKKNGIDQDKRIIGAAGNMPYLRNIDEELIERFRKQVEIINMAGETNSQKIETMVDKLLEGKTEEFKGEAVQIKKTEEIEAKPAKWIADPKGYFVISLNNERTKIMVDHYIKGEINKRIIGKNAKEICDTIARLKLIGEFEQSLEHSMYLGRELEKAEIALRENLDFEQDKELKIKKLKKQEPTNEYGWFD
ncbi:MAG: tetrahydromethanopterin S-methyltransferase subunit A [Candidatus Nealsonbacteria bacterium]